VLLSRAGTVRLLCSARPQPMLFVRADPLETPEKVFDAHDPAFAFSFAAPSRKRVRDLL
jgi:hypothetical protein